MKYWHVKTLLDAYSSSLLVLDSLHLHVSVAHPSASSSGSGFSLALAYMNSTLPFTLFVLLVHFVCFALLYYHFIHWLNSPTHPPTELYHFVHSFVVWRFAFLYCPSIEFFKWFSTKRVLVFLFPIEVAYHGKNS